MNTIHQFSQYAFQGLKGSYPEHEIQSICHIIYMDVFHFTKIDIHIRKTEQLDKSFSDKFTAIIGCLKSGQPLQYILGETEFAGLRFHVNRSTLIPRPETRELVLWAATSLSPGKKVLDIGTGSGCIAICLAHDCPGIQVTGVDISAEAVATARQNARRNQTGNTTFLQRDILRAEHYSWPVYDLIISNPPYVRESEKKDMQTHVLDYEPHQALFVPDEDPLLFYRHICAFGQQHLSPQGWLYFEMNEALGTEVATLMENHGYQNVEVKKDFYGKDRMVRGSRA